jgi:hypothetical protein
MACSAHAVVTTEQPASRTLSRPSISSPSSSPSSSPGPSSNGGAGGRSSALAPPAEPLLMRGRPDEAEYAWAQDNYSATKRTIDTW